MYITDKINRMKHLTFLLLLFSIGLSGQINDKFYKEEMYLLNIDSNFLWAYNPDYKIPIQNKRVIIVGGEEIEVISSYDTQNITFDSLPIIDTTHIHKRVDTIPIKLLISFDGILSVVDGYYVNDWLYPSYLDKNKKPFNTNFIIWKTIGL